MEDSKKTALKALHPQLRAGIILTHILPDCRKPPEQLLTDVEYLRVFDKTTRDRISAVDEFVHILLTKSDREFDLLCEILSTNGYSHWAKDLRVRAQANNGRSHGIGSHIQSGVEVWDGSECYHTLGSLLHCLCLSLFIVHSIVLLHALAKCVLHETLVELANV